MWRRLVAAAQAHHWTDAFAPGQMLTFDPAHVSNGLPPQTWVTVPAEQSRVAVLDGGSSLKGAPVTSSLRQQDQATQTRSSCLELKWSTEECVCQHIVRHYSPFIQSNTR